MNEFFENHSGKVLVLAVFLALLLFAHHAASVPAEAKFGEYCISKSGEAFAAFLGLITGQLMRGNGNGTKSNGPAERKPVDPTPALASAASVKEHTP